MDTTETSLGGGSSQISSIPSLESWERNLETLGEFLFRAKKEWHERQARLSFSEKIKIMDRLLESVKSLPKRRLIDG